MKLSIRISSIILVLFIILPLSACFDPNYDWDLPEREPVVFPPIGDLSDMTTGGENVAEAPEDGVILHLSDDGTYYIAAGCRDKNVETLIIPESVDGIPVTEIAASAFEGMLNLKSISIPDSVLRVGQGAFDRCPYLPYKVDRISSLQYLGSENNSHHILLGIKGASSSPILTVYNSTVVIADGAFDNYTKIRRVNIPASVKTVGDFAFRGCTELEEINFQGNVEYIGEGAFASCSKLGSVTIPDGVKTLGERAFENCNRLRSVSIGGGVTVLEEGTFEGCVALAEVDLGTRLKTIEKDAFKGCWQIRNLVLPFTVRYVSAEAFTGYSSLLYTTYSGGRYLPSKDNQYFLLFDVEDKNVVDLDLHNDTEYIAYGLFGSLEQLRNVSINNNTLSGKYLFTNNNCIYAANRETKTVVCGMNHSRVNSYMEGVDIGDYAFYGCDLTSFQKLNQYVKNIGDYAFANCRGADTIRFFSHVESIGEGAFMNIDSLKSIYFNGNAVKSIGDYAFWGCDGLSVQVELPEGLTELGASAFEGCKSLTSVKLPETLESIGGRAFADCSSLLEITIGTGVKRVGVDMLVNTSAAIKYAGECAAWHTVINRDAIKNLEPYVVFCRDDSVKYEQ